MPEHTDGIQGRRFGVEIEFNSLCVQGAHDLLQHHGIAVNRDGPYEFGVDAPWRVVPECSTEAGAELNTPVLDSADPASYDLIRRVMEILVEDGRATVGRNVGVHVHVYAGDLSATSMLDVVRWSGHYHRAWAELVGSYRGQRLFEQARAEAQQTIVRVAADSLIRDRYPGFEEIASFASSRTQSQMPSWVDQGPSASDSSGPREFSGGTFWQVCMGKFPRNGTLEFRAHHSTLSGERICNWAYLVANFVDYCHTNPGSSADDDGSTSAMLRRFVDPQTAQWLSNYPQPVHALRSGEVFRDVSAADGGMNSYCDHPECDDEDAIGFEDEEDCECSDCEGDRLEATRELF